MGRITAHLGQFDVLLPRALPMKCTAYPMARNLHHLRHVYLDTWQNLDFGSSSFIIYCDRDALWCIHIPMYVHKGGRCREIGQVAIALVAELVHYLERRAVYEVLTCN